jgi:GAF domain-containing protein
VGGFGQSESFSFGEGITGWAVDHREAVLANRAPRPARTHAGDANSLRALIAVPHRARPAQGTLNIYRVGETRRSRTRVRLAKRFGDAAALAIDNAHIRARLEHRRDGTP